MCEFRWPVHYFCDLDLIATTFAHIQHPLMDLLLKFLSMQYHFMKTSCTSGYNLFYLVVWGLSSHSRMFYSDGDVTITGEGLQMLTYARHSWSSSSDSSLECHHYYIVFFRHLTLDNHIYNRAFNRGVKKIKIKKKVYKGIFIQFLYIILHGRVYIFLMLIYNFT